MPLGQLYKHACNGTRLQKSEGYPCTKQLVNDSNPSVVVVGLLCLDWVHRYTVINKIIMDEKNNM